jgi:hypothetical protein
MSSDLVSSRNASNMNAYESQVVGVNHCSSFTYSASCLRRM